MNLLDSIDLILAQFKDAISEETRNHIARSYIETLKAEADARRYKAANDLLRMNKLKIAVKKLEYQYSKVRTTTGRITSIEDLIRSANQEIQLISLHKN